MTYFDKSIMDINYSEAALLAALQKHQANIIHIEIIKLLKKKELGLKRMYENGLYQKIN